GLLSISLQPDATVENSSYRGEIAGGVELGFTKHQLLLGASQNIRDALNSPTVAALCPGAVTCVQNIFHPVDIPETPFPPNSGTRTRINDIGYYLFDRVEMATWLQLLAGVRKVDYTESNLDTGAISFHAKPTSISYGAMIKPRSWMSLYG